MEFLSEELMSFESFDGEELNEISNAYVLKHGVPAEEKRISRYEHAKGKLRKAETGANMMRGVKQLKKLDKYTS